MGSYVVDLTTSMKIEADDADKAADIALAKLREAGAVDSELVDVELEEDPDLEPVSETEDVDG